jgi:hypothetical protein
MSVDFPYLNKAFPEDNHPLSKINWLVNSTTSFEYLSFLDANSYHQITMLHNWRGNILL